MNVNRKEVNIMIGTIETTAEKGKIIITITPGPGQQSKTGKSKVYASTQGFVQAGTYSLNLNLISKD